MQVVFPCLDEAAALPALLRRVPAGYGIIVVDNGSSDESGAVAAAHGARVVREARRGYGSAVHAGLLAATADVVAVMDCDGSLDPQELTGLVGDVAGGLADLAVGRRLPTERSSWAWHSRTGNRALAWYLRRYSGLGVRDIGPVRVARRIDLLALDVRDRRSGYPVETLLLAARAGWRVTEHDVSYAPRALGTKSKVSGSIRGTFNAMSDMTRVAAHSRRIDSGQRIGHRHTAVTVTGRTRR